MTYWQLFHFPSPVSFLAWHGEADIAERLFAEWGWVIDRREPADGEALARFLAYAPEPGNDQEMEHVMLSRWHGWCVLVFYWSFGSLSEAYQDYPVPIIEWTVPAGLVQLLDAPDFRLDLMLDQQHFCFVFVRNGTIWRDEKMHPEIEKHLVLQGEEAVRVEYPLNLNEFPGYGPESHLTFTTHLGQCLQVLGLPIQRWQNRDPDIVNEAMEIVWRPR